MDCEDILESTADNSEQEVSVSPASVNEAVLHATDWTVETLLSQFGRQNILIDPRFQRRDAWTIERKSRFIESLILNLPIPQIVLAERREERGKFIVLDGKQRLLTLLQFTGKAEASPNNEFLLSDLEVLHDMNGKSYSVLCPEGEPRPEINALLNQTIRSVFIRNWKDVDFLHMVFVRLNTGSVSLSPQELRQALFPGEFVNFVDDSVVASPGLKLLFRSNVPDFRMRDNEVLLRYLAFRLRLTDYAGDLKHFLDTTCQTLNREWNDKQAVVVQECRDFEQAIAAAAAVFEADNVGRKWTGSRFQGRLNRAILDAIVFYFAESSIRERAVEHSEQVLNAYKQLCSNDNDFLTAVETTTKSIDAVCTRLLRWGATLGAALGMDIPVPSLSNGRMVFEGFRRQ